MIYPNKRIPNFKLIHLLIMLVLLVINIINLKIINGANKSSRLQIN